MFALALVNRPLDKYLIGREDRIVSDTALLPRVCPGADVVSGLGPGLTF
jgi:hypothetical protein